jgi:ABC-type multidrug transport system ATPase subunit
MTETSAERRQFVDDLLRDLGLESCQHTVCGNQFLKGLSGGQKRRLSLAVALTKHPLVLFLDEPTSGLDSAAAVEILSVISKIKASRNIIVVCTIHQPSTRVYNQFDSILLLSAGRTAYFGPPAAATDHFARLGHDMPARVSESEFLLDLVNSDFGGAGKRACHGVALGARHLQLAPRHARRV